MSIEPSQFDSFTERLLAILRSLYEQVGTIRDAYKANDETRKEIPARLSELRVPANERADANTHRNKAHRQQVWLTWGTWLAFIAAAIYAGIAASQLRTMRKTYGEIEMQTKASQDAAYASCLNAQAAQATFLQIKKSANDSHAVAVATVKQTVAGLDSNRAIVSFNPRIPIAPELIAPQFEMPFSIKNDGKSEALIARVWFKATLVDEKDVFKVNDLNLQYIQGKYIPSGADYPGKPNTAGTNPITLGVDVRDTKEQIVLVSSQEAQRFLKGGSGETVMVYGHMNYSDSLGTHKAKFCWPLYIMTPNTTRPTPANDRICAKYNSQNDEYTEMPKIDTTPAAGLNEIQPISCVKPRD